MSHITANELKTSGVTALEEHLSSDDEVFISVRGKEKFVVLSMEKYAAMREYELERAVREARADYEARRIVWESADEHMQRINDEL